jgi:hypothetical protein
MTTGPVQADHTHKKAVHWQELNRGAIALIKNDDLGAPDIASALNLDGATPCARTSHFRDIISAVQLQHRLRLHSINNRLVFTQILTYQVPNLPTIQFDVKTEAIE